MPQRRSTGGGGAAARHAGAGRGNYFNKVALAEICSVSVDTR